VHGLEQEQVPPYVSVWCALDDMNEENGCLYILPYPAPPEPPTTLRDDRLLRFASPDHMRRHHLDMAHAYPSGILGGMRVNRGQSHSTIAYSRVRSTRLGRSWW
jgi:hypothetical protein